MVLIPHFSPNLMYFVTCGKLCCMACKKSLAFGHRSLQVSSTREGQKARKLGRYWNVAAGPGYKYYKTVCISPRDWLCLGFIDIAICMSTTSLALSWFLATIVSSYWLFLACVFHFTAVSRSRHKTNILFSVAIKIWFVVLIRVVFVICHVVPSIMVIILWCHPIVAR